MPRTPRIAFAIVISAVLLAAALTCRDAHTLSDKGYKALHNFSKVLHYIEENYVSEVDEEALLQGAVQGMVSTLDPHSVYMSPEINRELKVDTSGRFDGVGIEVGVRKGELVVVAPIRDSPAARAGIKAGDRIAKINGIATKNINLSEAVMSMRGRRGSRVTLTLLREGEKCPFNVTITRQIINVPSVDYELLGDGIAYASISSFQSGTARSLAKALKGMSKAEPIRGLVLDLRHNPGGLLEQAVEVSDLFLDHGVIVTTDNRGKEVDRREAFSEGTQPDYPIAVLIDGGSASAAEIVAGALKDHGRATVIGTTSFGKGSVQTVIDLDDDAGLKITIAYYRTPSGRLIHEQGVLPDIVVEAELPKVKKAEVEAEAGEEETEGAPEAVEPKVDLQRERAIEFLRSKAVIKRSEGSERS